MARAAALMYAAGSLLMLAITTVPHWPGMEVARLRLLAVPGALAGVTLELGWRWLPLWVHHVTAVCGTLLVSGAVAFAGGGASSMAVAMLYVWIALFAFSFFSLRAAFAHVVLIAACAVVALVLVDASAAPAAAITVLTSLGIAGGVAGWLVRKVRHLAGTDELTGLPNRRTWNQILLRAGARAARERDPLAIAVLDLDHFKTLNDRAGHHAGDRLLRDVALGWRAALRADAELARIGGDEFGLVLPACTAAEAHTILTRLCEVLPPGQTCSSGVAFWDGSESIDVTVQRADAALYEAKAAGRARQVVAVDRREGPACQASA